MTQTRIDMRILAKADERRYSLGVVYSPNDVDSQGEFAKADDISAAAWAFMERLQTLAKAGVSLLKAAIAADADGITLDITDVAGEDALEKGAGLDDMHLQVGDEEDLGVIVESYVAPVDMEIGGQAVKAGTWLLGVRWSEPMWKKIKSGERTGLSMYGRVDHIKNQPVAKGAAA